MNESNIGDESTGRFDHAITTPAALKKRYPYMFSGPDIGLSFYRGWLPMLVQLCHDIDQMLGARRHGFHWVQIKEKFGAGRFYYYMHQNTPRPKKEQLRSLVQDVAGRTQTSCMLCGNLGDVDRSKGYLLVLCRTHKAQRKAGTLPAPWFEQDE